MQNIFKADLPKDLEKILALHKSSRFLLVCDSAFEHLSIRGSFDFLSTPFTIFTSFSSNPLYGDAKKGVETFLKNGCDFIVAVGGGSAIDVAKCIKLFSQLDHAMNYLNQTPGKNDIPLAAVPTTAGTGSESTRYAVIYHKGEKQSVTHDDIIPSYALLIPDVLNTLPAYQKKCTMLDAFSQAVESYWSINSTEESRNCSKSALELMVPVMSEYINSGGNDTNWKIMRASNYSGRAINISQTTAVHAMSYKITSLYGIPHGHAVAICLPHVWEHMIHNTDNCLDPRGGGHLLEVLDGITRATGSSSPIEAVKKLKAMLRELEISPPADITSRQMETLVSSVNETRLKNHPVKLDRNQIRLLYKKIFNIEETDYEKM